MSAARDITGRDLIRALGTLAGIDGSVRSRAEAAAAALSGQGVTTRIFHQGSGRYVVSVTGGTPSRPTIDAAVAKAKAP